MSGNRLRRFLRKRLALWVAVFAPWVSVAGLSQANVDAIADLSADMTVQQPAEYEEGVPSARRRRFDFARDIRIEQTTETITVRVPWVALAGYSEQRKAYLWAMQEVMRQLKEREVIDAVSSLGLKSTGDILKDFGTFDGKSIISSVKSELGKLAKFAGRDLPDHFGWRLMPSAAMLYMSFPITIGNRIGGGASLTAYFVLGISHRTSFAKRTGEKVDESLELNVFVRGKWALQGGLVMRTSGRGLFNRLRSGGAGAANTPPAGIEKHATGWNKAGLAYGVQLGTGLVWGQLPWAEDFRGQVAQAIITPPSGRFGQFHSLGSIIDYGYSVIDQPTRFVTEPKMIYYVGGLEVGANERFESYLRVGGLRSLGATIELLIDTLDTLEPPPQETLEPPPQEAIDNDPLAGEGLGQGGLPAPEFPEQTRSSEVDFEVGSEAEPNTLPLDSSNPLNPAPTAPQEPSAAMQDAAVAQASLATQYFAARAAFDKQLHALSQFEAVSPALAQASDFGLMSADVRRLNHRWQALVGQDLSLLRASVEQALAGGRQRSAAWWQQRARMIRERLSELKFRLWDAPLQHVRKVLRRGLQSTRRVAVGLRDTADAMDGRLLRVDLPAGESLTGQAIDYQDWVQALKAREAQLNAP